MPASYSPMQITVLLTTLAAAGIAPTWASRPEPGRLTIESDGPEVSVGFEGPSLAMVGFERAPRDDAERENLALTRENLKTGDAMVRLSTAAGCRLIEARVDAEPAPGKGETEGRLGARYRFHCDRPASLDSAAVGIFIGFPFLPRILVTYRIDDIRGEAALTPINPVVQFIPLQ